MNIGTKIKILRESKKLSQNELADQLEISQGWLCKIESGMVEKIDFTLMHKICDFFEVDFQYFLEDSCSQTNQDNKNSAISIFGNPVVYNNLPENVIETIMKNQEQITQLIERQNRLIEGLKQFSE
jgi:transcriptional regulator with XRE-family HTH domain